MEHRFQKPTTTTTQTKLQTLQERALGSHQIPLDNNINLMLISQKQIYQLPVVKECSLEARLCLNSI